MILLVQIDGFLTAESMSPEKLLTNRNVELVYLILLAVNTKN